MSQRSAVDGLIIREYPIDNDKILTVLTRDGRITVSAKGAKSPRSSMLGISNLFTYGNFEFYERGGRRWLSGGTVEENFPNIFSNIREAALAAYIADLANEISGENMESSEILSMTLNTLYVIDNKLKPCEQVKAVYELFAVSVSGVIPDLEGCCRCGEKTGSVFWLDVMNGGLVCDKCIGAARVGGEVPYTDQLMTRNIFLPLDPDALLAMRYTLSAPIKRKFAFGINDRESMMRFCRAAETYLINHLERSFDSLEFYRSCKE